MKVSVEIKSGREWVKRGMFASMGRQGMPKAPLTDETLRDLLVAMHSPIEEYEVWVDAIVPERVHTHIVRHKEVGKYVATSRPDIWYHQAIEDGERMLSLRFNAKRLIEVMQKRLCLCSWSDTVSLFQEIRKQLVEVEPMFQDVLAPTCVWYGFCPEPKKCGYNKSKQYEVLRKNLTGEE